MNTKFEEFFSYVHVFERIMKPPLNVCRVFNFRRIETSKSIRNTRVIQVPEAFLNGSFCAADLA